MLVKPDGCLSEGLAEAQRAIREAGLAIIEERKFILTTEVVHQLYPQRAEGPFWGEICAYLTTRPSVLFVVMGDGALRKLVRVKGKTGEWGLREKFAHNFIHNTFHCPDNEQQCEEELLLLDGITCNPPE